MQILVVVAINQVRHLTTEVEKGSVRTVIGHGLFDPKTQGSSDERVLHSPSKGNTVNIP